MFGSGGRSTNRNWCALVLIILIVVGFSSYLRAQAPQLPAQQVQSSTILDHLQLILALIDIASAVLAAIAFLFPTGVKLWVLKPENSKLIMDTGQFVSRDDLCREVKVCLSQSPDIIRAIQEGGAFLTRTVLLEVLLLEILEPEKCAKLRLVLLDESEVGRMVDKSLQERIEITKVLFSGIRRRAGSSGKQ
jgi:hypothetical protein